MNKSSIPWTTKQIVRMFENNCLRFDNVRQRGEVWDIARKSRLIDSMFRGFWIPPIFTFKTEEKVMTHKGEASVYDCIDGKQRCTAIKQFKNNEFALAGLDPITIDGEAVDINGMTYDTLPEILKEEFDGTSFTIIFVNDATEEEIKQQMFRLNDAQPMTGVVKARILSKDLENIIELGEHEMFGDYLTTKGLLSYGNEDIVVKTSILLNDDEPSFENKRIREVYSDHEFSEEEKSRIIAILDKTREVISYLENENKKIYSKAIKRNNLLAIISYIAGSDKSVDEIGAKVLDFFTTDDGSISKREDYNNASGSGTNKAPKVMTRNKALEEFCNS